MITQGDIIALSSSISKSTAQQLVSVGIQSVAFVTPNTFKFTLANSSVQNVAIANFNEFTLALKNKLISLDDILLNKFTVVSGKLLFDGQPIGGIVNLIDDTTLSLTKTYSSQKIDDTYVKRVLGKSLVSDTDIAKISSWDAKTDKSYVDDQDATKANLVHTHIISDVTNLQSTLDNKVNIDGTKVLSQNDFTDLYQQKVDAMSNGSKYIGLFSTLTERNSYVGALIEGYWCSVETDIANENKKTKYYYDGVQWVFDGIYQDNSFGIDDISTTSTQNGWSANKLVNELALKANKNGTDINLTAVQGNIIPVTNGTQDIGSPTNRFSKIYVNEAMLSTNTLYIGDTPVLGTTDDTIMVKADLDQSLAVKTTGVGTTKVISANGVELSTSGMNANINVQATGTGSNANVTATTQVNLTAPHVNIAGETNITGGATVDTLTVNGNLVINGSSFEVEATTVRIEDNIIELNKDEVGYGVTAGKSGLKINRGDADDYLLVFDETDDMFKIGTDTSLQVVATQNYVNSNTHTHTNKSVIDKFTEVGGQPYYNGSVISGGTGISTWNTFNL